jgi:hypothetical protein
MALAITRSQESAVAFVRAPTPAPPNYFRSWTARNLREFHQPFAFSHETGRLRPRGGTSCNGSYNADGGERFGLVPLQPCR